MLLPAAFSELKPYKLGYNSTRGRVNRDRQIRIDRREEANAERQIWESAIRKDKGVVLPIYVDLLRNFPEAPDVESAGILLGNKALIRRHLSHDAGGKQFYYGEKSNAQVGPTTKCLAFPVANIIGAEYWIDSRFTKKRASKTSRAPLK